jgi:hypothetical protein
MLNAIIIALPLVGIMFAVDGLTKALFHILLKTHIRLDINLTTTRTELDVTPIKDESPQEV